MIKSKIQKLICVFLALIALMPCAVVSASEGEASQHPYPCYCETCVQLWNEEFQKFSSKTSQYVDFKGFIGQTEFLNGFFPFIFYYPSTDSLEFYFSETWSLSYNQGDSYFSLHFPIYYYSDPIPDSSSVDLSSLSFRNSYNLKYDIRFDDSHLFPYYEYYGIQNELLLIYIPDSSDSVQSISDSGHFNSDKVILSAFDYPEYFLSETDIFKKEFPTFLRNAWSDLSDFIIGNKLVLLIFALSLAGAIVGLVKRLQR